MAVRGVRWVVLGARVGAWYGTCREHIACMHLDSVSVFDGVIMEVYLGWVGSGYDEDLSLFSKRRFKTVW